jgi:uncharacterized protein (DUF2336 family)
MWLVSKKRLILVNANSTPSMVAAAIARRVLEIAAAILEVGF